MWRGDVTERQRSVIAAGGVMAQAAVWLATTLAVRFAPTIPYEWLWDVVYAWTTSNVFMMVVNLLPVAPLDGRIGTETMPGVFAQIGMEYGHKYGGTSFELFAKIAEKNHAHSTLNPLAAYTKRMTLDEILDVLTLRQLGYHAKPLLLLDHQRYWRAFEGIVSQFVVAGFADASAAYLYELVGDVPGALTRLDLVADDPARLEPRHQGEMATQQQ